MRVCDKCKLELLDDDFKITLEYRDRGKYLSAKATKNYELCEECFGEVKKAIEENIEEKQRREREEEIAENKRKYLMSGNGNC